MSHTNKNVRPRWPKRQLLWVFSLTELYEEAFSTQTMLIHFITCKKKRTQTSNKIQYHPPHKDGTPNVCLAKLP